MGGVSRRIKVLHIITRMIKGGAQENTLLTVVNLDKRRYETTLVTGPSLGTEGEIESKARSLGVNVQVIPELIRQINPILDAIALLKLFRFIKKGRYDIVHTHSSKAGILGRIAARLAGVPIVIHTPHSHIFYGYYGVFLSRIFIWIEQTAAPLADRIFALTRIEKEDHIRCNVGKPSQFVVVHSGVPLDRFLRASPDRNETRKRLGILPSDVVCTFVARLAPVKGHRYLISAFARVTGEIDNAKLLLIGDGELRRELEAQTERLGISEKVIFAGLRDDVPDLLAVSDLFVLSSINEGMGRVLVEAMAAGLPVVATRVGGVPAVVVDGETGILVPPSDPDAMAKAIIELLKDRDLREKMGRVGRSRVYPDFTVEAMVRKIENVYEKLIEEKGIHRRKEY